MINVDLSEFFTTKRQAADFETALSNIESGLYETKFDLEKVLKNHLGVNKKDKFLILLRENRISLDSNSDIKDFFSLVRKSIASMVEATLVIAIEPNEDILKTVSNWFVLNLQSQVLINTEVNSAVVGGAEVYFRGKHYDASVRNIFKDKCTKILDNNKDLDREKVEINKNKKSDNLLDTT